MLMRMIDDATLDLAGSEDDLRDLIFNQPTHIEPEFRPHEREYETPAGPVDIWGHNSEGTPVILELKRRRVDPEAISTASLPSYSIRSGSLSSGTANAWPGTGRSLSRIGS